MNNGTRKRGSNLLTIAKRQPRVSTLSKLSPFRSRGYILRGMIDVRGVYGESGIFPRAMISACVGTKAGIQSYETIGGTRVLLCLLCFVGTFGHEYFDAETPAPVSP